jgi:ribosomal protein L14E/L6E/L27E
VNETITHSFFDAMKDKGIITGTVVLSRCGHDKGRIAVVFSEKESFLYLCDGRLRSIGKPKKKRRSHVRPLGQIQNAEEWCTSLKALPTEVQNSEIRKAIRRFLDCHTDL